MQASKAAYYGSFHLRTMLYPMEGFYLVGCSPLVPQESSGIWFDLWDCLRFIHILLEQILFYKKVVPNRFFRTAWFFLSPILYFHKPLSIDAVLFVIKHRNIWNRIQIGRPISRPAGQIRAPLLYLCVDSYSYTAACAFQLIGNDRPFLCLNKAADIPSNNPISSLNRKVNRQKRFAPI